MSHNFRGFIISIFALLTALVGSVALAHGDNSPQKDPADWYSDDTTPREQYQTAKKEAASAYRDALRDCREQHGNERNACIKDARATYSEDLSDAKKILEQ